MASMDDRPEETPPTPTPFGDVLGDVPLFRELQRVLLSGTGPVNWELGRQVGIAVASWNQEDPPPTEDDRRSFEEVVRAAELEVARFTGMEAPSALAEARCDRRATWVESNITSLRPVFEPVAAKLAGALSDVREETSGAEAPMLEVLMDRMAPLLLGAQLGTVLGYLGQRVLGQYDVAVPRDAGVISFVVPNVAQAEAEWSLDPREFRAWVAIHEVTHRFEFARPWVRDHFAGLVRDFTESTEFDLSGLEERLAGLDLSDPERLGDAFGSPNDLIGRTLTDEGRLLLARVQAFTAAAEGYGDHVTHAVGRSMLTTYGRIDEALRRRNEGVAGETRLVEQLLGIEAKAEQYELGRRFCDTVAARASEGLLARMWDQPETLPSMPELEEPTLWLSRVG
jgi:coenzyme F420 biosynthesis associated uncharacterized protein